MKERGRATQGKESLGEGAKERLEVIGKTNEEQKRTYRFGIKNFNERQITLDRDTLIWDVG